MNFKMRLNPLPTRGLSLSVFALYALCGGCSESTSGDDGGSSTGVLRVDAASTSLSPDGSSWTAAFPELFDALAVANSGDEIWVASGTYYPTAGVDRSVSLTLVSGVSVYGGFDATETERSARDHATNVTILSGDIDQNGVRDFANSYHVLRGADGAILDGFTITKGNAAITGPPPADFADLTNVINVASGHESDEILRILTGVPYIAGGGMLNLQAAPTVRNCIFEDNGAGKGGAVYNMVQRDYPTFGVFDAATFEDCIFRNNVGSGRGGAVNTDMLTDPTFISCQFLDNACDDKGGALYCDLRCNSTLVNVLFAGNTAERGAALVSDGSSSPKLLYVTLVNNAATDIGGGLYQGTYGAQGQSDGQESSSNDPLVMQSLVMGNTSGASGSSISSWHDCAPVFDGNSVVEATDGTVTLSTHFNDPGADDYEPIGASASLGWSASRDTSNWETEITSLSFRTYADDPYDTLADAGTAGTYYVDQSAAGGGGGLDWANAFTNLQDALTTTVSGDIYHIAEGTYYPTTPGGSRETAFVVTDGIQLYGGYAAGGASRDPATYPTVLSGDIDLNGQLDSDNSYHVLVGSSNTTLDGLTVTRGYADGEWDHQRGGGALLTRAWSDALVQGSDFISNSSTDRGGAVYIDYGAWPTLELGCTFT
ncbi:MAG: hypothetical protein GY926_16165, partial [bacterium]|nr:hypothetical protein [bacterium]